MRRHPSVADPARWRRVRAAVLRRDGRKCAECGARATDVDHVKPVSQGGAWWAMWNLAAMCGDCHRAKSKREARPLGPRARAWEAFVAGDD